MRISVQDTGIGILEKDKSKLFKLFGFLKDTCQLNKNGVGLGLVISKQIVEKFEGEIFLSSEYGKGSTFTFIILLEDIEESPE